MSHSIYTVAAQNLDDVYPNVSVDLCTAAEIGEISAAL